MYTELLVNITYNGLFDTSIKLFHVTIFTLYGSCFKSGRTYI